MSLRYLLLSIFATATALGQSPTIEQRLAELERRVATLEQSANAKTGASAPASNSPAIAAIYEAKREAEGIVAAKNMFPAFGRPLVIKRVVLDFIG